MFFFGVTHRYSKAVDLFFEVQEWQESVQAVNYNELIENVFDFICILYREHYTRAVIHATAGEAPDTGIEKYRVSRLRPLQWSYGHHRVKLTPRSKNVFFLGCIIQKIPNEFKKGG